MWRDAEEELQRLEAELLAEEEPVEEEDLLEDALLDELLQDTRAENVGVYQNFSNDYGKKLRNYASGYKAYNSDKTDEDLECYSETVREPEKGITGLVITAIALTLGILAVLAWWLLRYRGVL